MAGYNSQYLIFRPEKMRWLHIFCLLILRRRSLTAYNFVEAEAPIPADAITVLTLFIQKTLSSISKPLKCLGLFVEFFLNLLSLNAGILGLIKRIITASVVIPKRDAANFRSIIGHIDGRVKLGEAQSPSDLSSGTALVDFTMLASKIAYENPSYIQNTVDNIWKMHFVGFYSCWNKFLGEHATQAYIACDKETDAELIVVAFRGTELFNAQDWSTDVNLSWLSANKLGNLHTGFLQALGLQDDKSFLLGFPPNLTWPPDKPVAYYALRDALRSLLKVHRKAKLVVTGHSLGGALACLFPALLAFHAQADLLSSLLGVFTYGQPRVGDARFGAYMKAVARGTYYRMVYRFDVVPRVPFDAAPVSLFKHCGTCVYYKTWSHAQVVDDAPNPNYFDPLYAVPMYLNAWGDLLQAFFIGWTKGREYREGIVSILYRTAGLIIPGISSHSPRDYVNGGRLAKIQPNTIL